MRGLRPAWWTSVQVGGAHYMSPTEKVSHGQLPAHIDPMQLAEKGAHLAGTLSCKSMTRLTQACLDADGEVAVDLQFGRDPNSDVSELHGTLRTAVRIACQRCLEPMVLELRTDTRLLLRRPGERPGASAEEAEVLTIDRPVSLSELVEDELLLVMPMVPMHPLAVCPAKQRIKMPAAPRTDKPLSALPRRERT